MFTAAPIGFTLTATLVAAALRRRAAARAAAAVCSGHAASAAAFSSSSSSVKRETLRLPPLVEMLPLPGARPLGLCGALGERFGSPHKTPCVFECGAGVAGAGAGGESLSIAQYNILGARVATPEFLPYVDEALLEWPPRREALLEHLLAVCPCVCPVSVCVCVCVCLCVYVFCACACVCLRVCVRACTACVHQCLFLCALVLEESASVACVCLCVCSYICARARLRFLCGVHTLNPSAVVPCVCVYGRSWTPTCCALRSWRISGRSLDRRWRRAATRGCSCSALRGRGRRSSTTGVCVCVCVCV
jgi:hypothetical protein